MSFGKVAPEVQYLISSFQRDFRLLRERSGGNAIGVGVMDGMVREAAQAQMSLLKTTVATLRGIFRLHKVNLLDIFKVSEREKRLFVQLSLFHRSHAFSTTTTWPRIQSPLMQIPVFWYFAIDIRKIINGSDPALAQQLVDSSFLWITDLTEPDPWYGLPIITGLLLYWNVETAVGKKALSGETSSQSRMALFLKDAFQSLAVFMPCFMAQQPSGVQIYLTTSMLFSLLQSVAMRDDAVREYIGLPALNAKPVDMGDSSFVQEFMREMKERDEAKARGGFVVGEGILKIGSHAVAISEGEKRKSSIVVEKSDEQLIESGQIKAVPIELPTYTISSLLVNPQLLDVWSAKQTLQRSPEMQPVNYPEITMQSMPDVPLHVMEAANRGERVKEIEMAPKELLQQREEMKNKSVRGVDVNKLRTKMGRQRGKPGKKGKK